MTENVTVRPLEAGEFFDWIELYAGYGEFYETPLTDEKALVVWSWIQDPDHELNALVAVDAAGTPVGLAHYRAFARPLAGGAGLYLDDLFVSPASRGQGTGAALLDALKEKASCEGFSVVRWITAADNATAQRLYDRVATKTAWVTYDLVP
jgi:GNAT superfamily N-acetyltransferase